MFKICGSSNKQSHKFSKYEKTKNKVQLSLIIVGDTGEKAFSSKALNKQSAVHIIKKVNFIEMKKYENNIQYQISIWDTAGQERFRSLAKSHFKKAVFKYANFEDGVLLVFDLSKLNSLSGIIDWMKDISENTTRDLPLVLIGNKCDKKDKGNEKELDNMLEKIQMKNFYIECSAKTGQNITEIFDFIFREVIKDYKQNRSTVENSKTISLIQMKKKKKFCFL